MLVFFRVWVKLSVPSYIVSESMRVPLRLVIRGQAGLLSREEGVNCC